MGGIIDDVKALVKPMTSSEDVSYRFFFASQTLFSTAKVVYLFAMLCFSMMGKVKEKGTSKRKMWKRAFMELGINFEKSRRDVNAFFVGIFNPKEGIKMSRVTKAFKPAARLIARVLE